MRTQRVTEEIRRLLGEIPFRPFVVTVENGQRIEVEHPENIIFLSAESGPVDRDDFYVRTGASRLHSTFEAVTSITVKDESVDEE